MGAGASTAAACRYVCHQCGISFTAERATVSTCIRCNGAFIEQLPNHQQRVMVSREVVESLQMMGANGDERMDATELMLNLSAFGGPGIMHYSPAEDEHADVAEAVTRSLEQGAPARSPAAEEAKEKLGWVTVDQELINSGACVEECAICWEDVEVGDKLRELPCTHAFHHACLMPWLDVQDFCPVCRQQLGAMGMEAPSAAGAARETERPSAEGSGNGDASTAGAGGGNAGNGNENGNGNGNGVAGITDGIAAASLSVSSVALSVPAGSHDGVPAAAGS